MQKPNQDNEPNSSTADNIWTIPKLEELPFEDTESVLDPEDSALRS